MQPSGTQPGAASPVLPEVHSVSIWAFDDFELFERVGKSGGGWRSLKLVRAGRHKKRNWWLGWNGERLARSSDAGKLYAHHGEVYEKILKYLEGVNQ
jgi:hypothetical protein